MKTSEATDKVLPALLAASNGFRPVVFDATNTHFRSKYATLPAYLDAVCPALRANGLMLTQGTVVAGGFTVIETRITHAASGQWIGSEYPVHPVKPDPQAEGSALTYARRYALSALLGLAADDDDGNTASSNAAAHNGKPQPVKAEGQPTSGVWESVDAETQAGLLKCAATIGEFIESGDSAGAWEFIERQAFNTDEKAALWTRLDSKTRTALKKAHEQRKAA